MKIYGDGVKWYELEYECLEHNHGSFKEPKSFMRFKPYKIMKEEEKLMKEVFELVDKNGFDQISKGIPQTNLATWDNVDDQKIERAALIKVLNSVVK